MDIDKALRDAKLDIRLRGEDAPNSWYGVMEFEAGQLCAGLKNPPTFTFSADSQLQAYAVYESRLVVVTAGLFDFLCRTAGRLVASGVFRAVGNLEVEPTWSPDPLRSERTPRELLQAEPFDVKSPPWDADSERAGLFFYLLLTLFRFVVLHELGHFYHRHGDRSEGKRVGLSIDTAQPRLLPAKEAIDSQARELVADQFAMRVLVGLQESERERIFGTKLTSMVGTELLDTAQKRAAFLLSVAYIYFCATDRFPAAIPEDAVRRSHPPAAFRLTTIAASMMEGNAAGVGEEAAQNVVLATGVVGDALLAVALDREPDPVWLARMQDIKFSEHYRELYERVDVWTCKAPLA